MAEQVGLDQNQNLSRLPIALSFSGNREQRKARDGAGLRGREQAGDDRPLTVGNPDLRREFSIRNYRDSQGGAAGEELELSIQVERDVVSVDVGCRLHHQTEIFEVEGWRGRVRRASGGWRGVAG